MQASSTRPHIYDPRERAAVRAADLLLQPLTWLRAPATTGQVTRVLLMRLERIGDLLMVLDAIHDARLAWPAAEIDLAVGSWNAPIARLIRDVNRVELVNAPWLTRGQAGQSWPALVRQARGWRARKYDVIVNFEPDIRSNFLAWLGGATRRFGYALGGGGAFMTDLDTYVLTDHVSDNARRLVQRASGGDTAVHLPSAAASPAHAALSLPAESVDRANAIIGAARRPLIGLHASGGRESKQWHLDRFGAAAREIAGIHQGTIVLTGTAADRPIVDAVRKHLDDVPVIDATGALELPDLAALLARLDLFVTGDTGPMHLAAAMGTPIVALFGPSDPNRYGPLSASRRVLRVDLPCSPCGQVRLPPERCRGHVPDCMDGIQVAAVVGAAAELLAETAGRRRQIG